MLVHKIIIRRRQKSCTYYPYDCHDLKMLYCLVGKVNWNNQYRSNLLCLCNKQEGVVDNNGNKCVLMMDENFISRWQRITKIQLTQVKRNTWQETTPANGLLNQTKVLMVSIFVLVFTYYYRTTKLTFILFFSKYIKYNINRIWNPPKAASYQQSQTRCLPFMHGHNKKTAETIEIHAGTAIV